MSNGLPSSQAAARCMSRGRPQASRDVSTGCLKTRPEGVRRGVQCAPQTPRERDASAGRARPMILFAVTPACHRFKSAP
jgi:hypothetical protein